MNSANACSKHRRQVHVNLHRQQFRQHRYYRNQHQDSRKDEKSDHYSQNPSNNRRNKSDNVHEKAISKPMTTTYFHQSREGQLSGERRSDERRNYSRNSNTVPPSLKKSFSASSAHGSSVRCSSNGGNDGRKSESFRNRQIDDWSKFSFRSKRKGEKCSELKSVSKSRDVKFTRDKERKGVMDVLNTEVEESDQSTSSMGVVDVGCKLVHSSKTSFTRIINRTENLPILVDRQKRWETVAMKNMPVYLKIRRQEMFMERLKRYRLVKQVRSACENAFNDIHHNENSMPIRSQEIVQKNLIQVEPEDDEKESVHIILKQEKFAAEESPSRQVENEAHFIDDCAGSSNEIELKKEMQSDSHCEENFSSPTQNESTKLERMWSLVAEESSLVSLLEQVNVNIEQMSLNLQKAFVERTQIMEKLQEVQSSKQNLLSDTAS